MTRTLFNGGHKILRTVAEPTIKLHVRNGIDSPGHQLLTSVGKWPDQFDAIKQSNFGEPLERVDPVIWETQYKPALMLVYRYCLWADWLELEGSPGSGVGERPGNDFVVASGFVELEYAISQNQTENARLARDALAARRGARA